MSDQGAMSPMSKRVLEGLADRNLNRVPPEWRSEWERELGPDRHLPKIIGRSRSGRHILMSPALSELMGIRTDRLGYRERLDRELSAFATPEAVAGDVDRYLENEEIEPRHDNPELAAKVAMDIRRVLIMGRPQESGHRDREAA